MHTRLRVLRSCSKPSCISSINCSKDLKSLTDDDCDDDNAGGRDDDEDDEDDSDGDEDGGDDGDKDGGNDGDDDGLGLAVGTVNTDVDNSVDVVDDIALTALVELSTGKSSSISGKGSSNSIQLSIPIDEGEEGERVIYIYI